ncbi:hypothetical protein GCM10014713_08310 [Streptomyces purpureus]|uniref:Uncharacterized protein n=1 Tax=Streptomyces purpureus TaxID=1951 RepID=A0A918LM83_9ACTN|nr:hypothetical protein GCM10014713_08310 [Streptomyces purpureus]
MPDRERERDPLAVLRGPDESAERAFQARLHLRTVVMHRSTPVSGVPRCLSVSLARLPADGAYGAYGAYGRVLTYPDASGD